MSWRIEVNYFALILLILKAKSRNGPLTLFRMGGRKALTNFSSVISKNIEISPQDFLTFSFKPFATLITKVITSLIEMLELTTIWLHDHI